MQTDNKRKGIEGIGKWPFLHGRLTSEKSFVAVIVVVVVLSKSDRFSESSQQQALFVPPPLALQHIACRITLSEVMIVYGQFCLIYLTFVHNK